MKKLFAILMSIMMIACFMPTMAFAGGELSFEDKAEYDIPAGKKGETYTATVALTATGGTEPYTFTVDPEVTGLSINGENKLVYTRSAVQEATTATIKVTDSASASKTIEIAIGAVTEPAAELSFEDKAEYDIPAGKKGETYTATVALTATGGTEPYTFTVDPEVTGLSINGENKLVYTRSAVQEATTATIKVTDSASASKTIEIAIGAVTEPAPAASATVDKVTISGKTGTAIADQDVVITLKGDTFNAMEKAADVKDWFKNLPAGLDAKIKDAVTEGATMVTVTISGKPTATSSAAMIITIPEGKVVGNAAVNVTDNSAAKYNITAPNTGSGGGSYYPYTPSTPSKPAAPNLDKTKTDSTTALNAAATANKYDAAEQAEVKKILDKANADIKNAKTEAEVKAIQEAAQAEIDKILTTEEKAIVAALDNVEKRDFATKSKVITRKGGKKVIRLTWTAPDGVDVDGYEIFRSTKKNSGFGKKPYFTTSNTSYTNTKDLKAGKTYYYKVRAFVVINGERVYTDYSLKANRKL